MKEMMNISHEFHSKAVQVLIARVFLYTTGDIDDKQLIEILLKMEENKHKYTTLDKINIMSSLHYLKGFFANNPHVESVGEILLETIHRLNR